MRKLVLVLMVGCAPVPIVKLRVDPAAAARLDAPARQQGQAAIEVAKKQLGQADGEAKRAETERTGPAAAESKQRTAELDAVMRAGEDRWAANLSWRRTQAEVARWQLAVAEAQLELVTAEAVARTGADVDPARFQAQAANMQSGRLDASRRAALARTQLEQREHTLSQAKDRYAATLRLQPQPATKIAGAKPR